MARITQQSSIHTTGTSYENEPIIKSDGAGEVMQWQPSDGAADGVYMVEGGSAGDSMRLGVGVAAPTESLDVVGKVRSYRNDSGVDSQMIIEQDGTGDSVLGFLLTGARYWLIGSDNSDSDLPSVSTSGSGSGSGFFGVIISPL